jgi:hypothetical protein
LYFITIFCVYMYWKKARRGEEDIKLILGRTNEVGL